MVAKTIQLRDVCVKIGSGATPRGGKEAYKGGPTSLIRSQNVHNDGFHRKGLVFIDDDQSAELQNVEVKPDDVLLNITGDSVARCCQVTADVLPARVNQHVAIIRPQSHFLDARFLRYVLISKEYQSHLLNLASAGATRPALTKTMIEELNIPALPLSQQKAIALILGLLDDKIALNRRMNATLEEMIQAQFKSWFVDFDPVHAKANGYSPIGMDSQTLRLFPNCFQDSLLGPIPRGWEVKTIGDISRRIAMGPFGSRITRDNFVTQGVPVVRGSNLTDGFIDDNFVFLKDSKADELKSALAYPQDIVFTHRGTLGQVGIIPIRAAYERYVVSQSQMLLSVDKSKVSPWMVYLFFRSAEGKHALLANTSTTGVPAISRPTTSLKAIPIAIPPTAISEHFDKIVLPIFLKRQENEIQIRTLATLRDVLLPKLMSGEFVEQVKEKATKVVPFEKSVSKEAAKKATDEFVEAVVIAQLVRKLAKPEFPLGRKRYNKLAYLAHRKAEDDVSQHYLKKAAGPYSPWAKYGGPEKIAEKNGYVKQGKAGVYSGLLPGESIDKIDLYLPNYPVCAAIDWVVDELRFKKNDDLELLTTVDFASLDLLREGQSITRESIKEVIAANAEWAPKLDRAIFSDDNVDRALAELAKLFPATYKQLA